MDSIKKQFGRKRGWTVGEHGPIMSQEEYLMYWNGQPNYEYPI